MQVWYFYRLVM